jgi:hypothetical protein
VNPFGAFLLQTLRSKLREIGRLSLIPKILALSAVQRQTAASKSTRFSIRLQHGSTGGFPSVTFNKPLSTLAQTPNFKASVGHLPPSFEGGGGHGFGVGFGFGFGFGLGPGQVLHALTTVKNRMLNRRNRASDLCIGRKYRSAKNETILSKDASRSEVDERTA